MRILLGARVHRSTVELTRSAGALGKFQTSVGYGEFAVRTWLSRASARVRSRKKWKNLRRRGVANRPFSPMICLLLTRISFFPSIQGVRRMFGVSAESELVCRRARRCSRCSARDGEVSQLLVKVAMRRISSILLIGHNEEEHRDEPDGRQSP